MKEVTAVKAKKKITFEVDPWLNKYSDVVLCPEKVEKAKKTFEKFGLPDLKKMK